jgi:hypothetical protein
MRARRRPLHCPRRNFTARTSTGASCAPSSTTPTRACCRPRGGISINRKLAPEKRRCPPPLAPWPPVSLCAQVVLGCRPQFARRVARRPRRHEQQGARVRAACCRY